MSTIGSLVVSLSMDGADFHRNVGKARQGLKDLGATAGKTGNVMRAAVHPAIRGIATVLGDVVPAAAGAESAISGMLTRLTMGHPLLLAATVAIGSLAFAFDQLRKAGRGEATLLLGGDSTAATQAETQAFERWQVISSAIQRREARARTIAEAQELAKRRADREAYDNDLLKKIQATHFAETRAWIDGTKEYADQLKARLDARAAFESQIGKGGIGTKQGAFSAGAAGGFGAIRDLTARRDKELRDLAFLKDQGFMSETDTVRAREDIRRRFLESVALMRQEFAAFPAVLDALQVVADRVDFSNLSAQMEASRLQLVGVGVATDGTINSLADFHTWLENGIPSAAQKTIDELALLNQWLAHTTAQFKAAEQAAKDFAGA